jgi:serine/threonine protein kinase
MAAKDFASPASPNKAHESQAEAPATPRAKPKPKGYQATLLESRADPKIKKDHEPFEIGIIPILKAGEMWSALYKGQPKNRKTTADCVIEGEDCGVFKKTVPYGPAADMCKRILEAQKDFLSDELMIVHLYGAEFQKDGTLTTYWKMVKDLSHPSEGCLDPKLMGLLITKTIDAMQHWRKRGIVQNDMKADNVFWDPKTNTLYFIDFDNVGEVGDVGPWKSDRNLYSFILGCDSALKGPYERGLYDQILAVFFIGFFMAKQSFQQVLAFTRSEEFTSRFPELAKGIAGLSRKTEPEDQAVQDLETMQSPKRKAEESPKKKKAQEKSPKRKAEESPEMKAEESPKKNPKKQLKF